MYGEVCGDGTSHSRIRAVCVPRVEEHDVDVCFHARPSTWQCGTLTAVFGSVCVCLQSCDASNTLRTNENIEYHR